MRNAAGKEDVRKLLRDVEVSVTAKFISTTLAMPLGTVYNHLKRLMDAGAVERWKTEGDETVYRVTSHGCLLADTWKGVHEIEA